MKKLSKKENVRVINSDVKKESIKIENKKNKFTNIDHAKTTQLNDLFLLKQLDRLCKAESYEISFTESEKTANKFKAFRKEYGAFTILGLLSLSKQIEKYDNDLKFSRIEIANLVSRVQNKSVNWHKENQIKVTQSHIDNGKALFESTKNADFESYFLQFLTVENLLKLSFKASTIVYRNAPRLFTTEIHKANVERFLKTDIEANTTKDRWSSFVNKYQKTA